MKGGRILVLTLCLGALGLQGCSEVRTALGNEKQSPDEFAVTERPPLSLPPNFALRPPVPGEATPRGQNVTRNAERLVLGGGSAAASGASRAGNTGTAPQTATRQSAGEAELRRLLRTADAAADIRGTVNRETDDFIYEEQYLIDSLLFWRDPGPKGVVVDAGAEQKRLQENAALGNPPTTGATPTIERKRTGLFN